MSLLPVFCYEMAHKTGTVSKNVSVLREKANCIIIIIIIIVIINNNLCHFPKLSNYDKYIFSKSPSIIVSVFFVKWCFQPF